MADPFEDFQFKPLTEGLGFHKKNKPEMSPEPNISFTHNDLSMLDSEEERSPLMPPLPRENKSLFKDLPVDDSSAAVEEILQTLRAKKVDAPVVKSKAPTAIKYKSSVQNISAIFLDSMLVLAATMLCMIILLSVTRVDLSATLFSPQPVGWIYLSTLTLLAIVTFIYLTVNRVFLGATPGEWAYDQRIGQPFELGTIGYTLSVTLRAALIVLTGIFVIPLISMIMKRDLAGELTSADLLERG